MSLQAPSLADRLDPRLLADRVAMALRADVGAGKYALGEKLPDVRRLAARFRVSKSTAASAVRILVNEGLLSSRRGRGTFVVSTPAGDAPSSPTRGDVLLAWSGPLQHLLAEPYYSGLHEALCRTAARHGYPLAFLPLESEEAALGKQLANLEHGREPTGILYLVSSGVDPTVLRVCKRHRLPMVMLDCCDEERSCHAVMLDNRLGMRLALEHLARLGHRRIAFVNSESVNLNARERLESYHTFLHRHGLPVEPGLVREVVPTISEGRRAGEELLRRAPTAVVCFNPYPAEGILLACAAAGVRVPEDLSLVCFGEDGTIRADERRLTAVLHEPREMAEAALTRLLDLQRSPAPPPYTVLVRMFLRTGDTSSRPGRREAGEAEKSRKPPAGITAS